jgi:hypothetical protein
MEEVEGASIGDELPRPIDCAADPQAVNLDVYAGCGVPIGGRPPCDSERHRNSGAAGAAPPAPACWTVFEEPTRE